MLSRPVHAVGIGLQLTGGGGLVTAVHEPDTTPDLEPTTSGSFARSQEVTILLDSWTLFYPSGSCERCHICLNQSKPISNSSRDSTNKDSG